MKISRLESTTSNAFTYNNSILLIKAQESIVNLKSITPKYITSIPPKY